MPKNSFKLRIFVSIANNKFGVIRKIILIILGGSLLESLHMAATFEAGEKKLEEALTSGRALKHLRNMFVQQGASAEVADALCRFKAFLEYDPEYELL